VRIPGHVPTVELNRTVDVEDGEPVEAALAWRFVCSCGVGRRHDPATRLDAQRAMTRHMVDRAHAIGLA
jgi:hypothetical protein